MSASKTDLSIATLVLAYFNSAQLTKLHRLAPDTPNLNLCVLWTVEKFVKSTSNLSSLDLKYFAHQNIGQLYSQLVKKLISYKRV